MPSAMLHRSEAPMLLDLQVPLPRCVKRRRALGLGGNADSVRELASGLSS